MSCFHGPLNAQNYDYDALETLLSDLQLTPADLGTDPDGDGLVTHIELGLGTDPFSATTDLLTISDSLRYPSVQDPLALGVSIQLEESTTLPVWDSFQGASSWDAGLVSAIYQPDRFYRLILERVENNAPVYAGDYPDLIITTLVPIQGFSDIDSDSLTYSLVDLPDGWEQQLVGDYIEINTGGETGYSWSTQISASDGMTTIFSEPFTFTDTYVSSTEEIGNDFSVFIDTNTQDNNLLLGSIDPLPLWGVITFDNADITVNPFESGTDYLTEQFFDANLNVLPDDASDPAGLYISAQTIDKDFYNIYWTVEDAAALSRGVMELFLINQEGRRIGAYIPNMPIGPAP